MRDRNKDSLLGLFMKKNAGLVVITGAGGEINYVNPAFEEATGFNLEEIEGRCFRDIFICPDERELFKAFFDNLDIEDFPFSHESRMLTRNGEIRLILWSYNIETAGGETIDYIFYSGIDITERSRDEEALRKMSDDSSAIINALPMAVVAFDKDCRVKSWNNSAERLFGWDEEEAAGNLELFFSGAGEGEFRRWCEYVLSGKALTDLEMRGQRKDGGMIDVSISQAPLRDADGAVIGIIAVIADVTNLKKK